MLLGKRRPLRSRQFRDEVEVEVEVKHFFDPALCAFNAKTVPVDEAEVVKFLDLAQNPQRPGFSSVRPNWASDVRWVSASHPETFQLFEQAFERLKIAEKMGEYVRVDRGVRLFCGYLVLRSFCEKPYFHCDWRKLNNQAFTLLTPVTENGSDFGLLYHDAAGKVREYAYKRGEAIVIGDWFSHSTKPGQSSEPVALLCFEFGSDLLEDWDGVFALMRKRAGLLRRPDGQFVYTGARLATGDTDLAT